MNIVVFGATGMVGAGVVTECTENVGRAMIRVAASGYSKHVLENPDINAAALAPAGESPAA